MNVKVTMAATLAVEITLNKEQYKEDSSSLVNKTTS